MTDSLEDLTDSQLTDRLAYATADAFRHLMARTHGDPERRALLLWQIAMGAWAHGKGMLTEEERTNFAPVINAVSRYFDEAHGIEAN